VPAPQAVLSVQQIIAGVAVATAADAAWPALKKAVTNAAQAALPGATVVVTGVAAGTTGRRRRPLAASGSVVSYTVTAINKDPAALSAVSPIMRPSLFSLLSLSLSLSLISLHGEPHIIRPSFCVPIDAPLTSTRPSLPSLAVCHAMQQLHIDAA